MKIKTLLALILPASNAIGQELQFNRDSQTFIIFSGLERLAITALGGLAIWLGYKLFFLILESNSIIEAQASGGYKLKLSKIGPGIFFCLFGTLLVGFSIFQPPIYSISENAAQAAQAAQAAKIANTSENKSTGRTEVIRGLSPLPAGHEVDIASYIKSIRLVQNMCTPGRFSHLSSTDAASLNEAKGNLNSLIRTLVDSSTSPGSYEWWEQLAGDAQINGALDPKLSEEQKNRYKALNKLIVGE